MVTHVKFISLKEAFLRLWKVKHLGQRTEHAHSCLCFQRPIFPKYTLSVSLIRLTHPIHQEILSYRVLEVMNLAKLRQ